MLLRCQMYLLDLFRANARLVEGLDGVLCLQEYIYPEILGYFTLW